MKWNAVALMIGLAVIMSCVMVSTALGQDADRPGLREGVDYALVATGEAAPFDGVVLTRAAMDRMLDERQWLLDRIDARDRAMSAAEELITLKEEQVESYRKDLRGARFEKWAWMGVSFVYTGLALNSLASEK